MNKNRSYFISFLKFHVAQKKVYGYILKTKDNLQFLDCLWQKNLIWGYKVFSQFLKVYFKYYLNKCSINFFRIYNSFVKIDYIKKYIQQYPQSIFIFSTSDGYKCGNYCVSYNLGGKLLLQIN